MPPSSPSTWRSIISEASAEASWCRAFARFINSCSRSGEMSWTRIVAFSGSFGTAIANLIYIKTIEMTKGMCGMLHFLRLRKNLG